MSFFEIAGKMAIGSRVRLLSELITTDAQEIYRLYGIEMNPKWFPVFFLQSRAEGTVTEIAEQIGHSHASVSKIAREMAKDGLLTEKASPGDRRRNLLTLSRKGRAVAEKIESQYLDVRAAVDEVSGQSTHDLWGALQDWEYLLREKSLLQRVREKKREREAGSVRIVPYVPKYRTAFRDLNVEWITTYFKMEQPDYDALDNPKKYVLDRGGSIFVALLDDKPVGVCALLRRDGSPHPFELAKMAVSPAARGRNIGWLLGRAVIDEARSQGAKKVFLESNTILKPAIGLYKKLGFRKIVGPPTPYERCNIQMELAL